MIYKQYEDKISRVSCNLESKSQYVKDRMAKITFSGTLNQIRAQENKEKNILEVEWRVLNKANQREQEAIYDDFKLALFDHYGTSNNYVNRVAFDHVNDGSMYEVEQKFEEIIEFVEKILGVSE